MAQRVFINFLLYVLIASFLLAQIDKFFVIAMLCWIFMFLSLIVIFYNKYEPLNNSFAKVRPKIYGFLADYFSNISIVRNFGNQKYEKNNLTNLTNEFIRKSTECGIFLRNYYAIHGIIVAIYMLIILSLLAYLSLEGKITPGDFALVFMINYKVVDLLFDISNNSRQFISNCGVVSNAIELLEYNGKIINSPKATNFQIKKGEIKFKNVTFSYNANNNIFRNLNITIQPKQKVGLVGYSGSGKSTFITLLQRLFEINDGEILIDGRNIKNITYESLLKAMNIVEQQHSLFHRTVFENIQYGKVNSTTNQVYEAAKKSKADQFIRKLSHSYETLVGERGVKLSGGQKQRIAIARAILKDGPIFILDEATSQLDSITEDFIQKNLYEIIEDKTAILVAHRLSTLSKVDRILVFEEGEIVQDGSREELLAQDGLFKKLWDSQKNGFLPNKRK